MATVKRFEDLEVWQQARKLATAIYQLTSNGTIVKDYELVKQMNRSVGSIMDNIAEGFDRGGKREFIQILAIARGSCAELKSQLYRALDRKHIGEEIMKQAYEQIEAITRMISGLIKYLNNSNIKGNKYQDQKT